MRPTTRSLTSSRRGRSEEHTSELQSHSDLVCRLLLEKNILPAARPQLDALAAGIRLLPAAQAVRIEGHTDAAGSDRYNEQLSQKRAYSVKRYLVAMHGIDPERLHAVGLGEYAPLGGRDPYAAEQRRVQFRGE